MFLGGTPLFLFVYDILFLFLGNVISFSTKRKEKILKIGDAIVLAGSLGLKF